jgi:hypothetical protein
MYTETLTSLDGTRTIIAEIENDISEIKCLEHNILQMEITIPEDVATLEKKKFDKRKYAPIFDYYLENGIGNLTADDLENMLNHNCRRGISCKFRLIFHNLDGMDVSFDTTRTYCRDLSFAFIQNSVRMRFRRYRTDMTYGQINNATKQEILTSNNYQVSIAAEHKNNKHGETMNIISYKGIKYTLMEDMYKRIQSSEYMASRDLANGGELWVISKEQKARMAKNNLLSTEEYNFIKYVNWDGTVII